MEQPTLFQTATAAPDVILLDYQCTMVENHAGRKAWFAANGASQPFTDWIRQERLRSWLVPLFGTARVILLTARRECWREATLDHIIDELDWLPDEAIFNPDGAAAPTHKRRELLNRIIPAHGDPGRTRYLALESNAASRRMFAANGVTAVRVPEDTTWNKLPTL